MEAVGFAIGAGSLAGAFTACVDCFEYIQLGRQFGQDYGKCLLKLDAAKVRITRWGVAMGLGPVLSLERRYSKSDIEMARNLLDQIMESFNEAERVSARFKNISTIKKSKTDDLLAYDANSDLDPSYQRLHSAMRELSIQRQTGTSIRKKAAWALYEKKKFSGMIEEVTDFITTLVELFPAAQEDQRVLCKTEVSAIREPQDLALLNDIAGKDDAMLAAAVKKEMNGRGHSVTDWSAGENTKLRIGDENEFGVEIKSHNAARFVLSGQAEVHIGNINRGIPYRG